MWKYFCGLCALFLLSCTSTSKEKTLSITEQTASRPDSFASDSVMLDYIQKVHFNYMWDGAEKTSGLAPERIHLDGNYPQNDSSVVTTGGSGFGIAGILVAIDRKFISREEGVARLHKIVDYLTRADRFHGVWPHWLDGPTGKVKPFGTKDDGGDLVESCFVMQSLLCVRQYFENGNQEEQQLCTKINKLWHEMEFDWYQNGKDVIYWHNGWARGGDIKTSAAPYGLPLELKHNGAEELGGPLFWAHYSYIGLDSRKIKDRYADYWNVVRNHALSDYRYCVENPKKYKGYGENCWGLTASYSVKGYAAHCPGENDLGVITPTAALSSFPYTPEESMRALKYFYSKGDSIWGTYGFYDAFSETDNWTVPHYLAIDQCTIAPMIENYRSGLLWNLFMSCPEIQAGLKNLGFEVKK